MFHWTISACTHSLGTNSIGSWKNQLNLFSLFHGVSLISEYFYMAFTSPHFSVWKSERFSALGQGHRIHQTVLLWWHRSDFNLFLWSGQPHSWVHIQHLRFLWTKWLCCSAYDIRFIGQVVCNKIDIIVLTSTYGGNCGICYLTLILLFWHKWPIRKCSQYPDSPKRDSMLSVTLWNFHAIWVNLCIESCHQRQKKPQIIERQNILLLPTAPCSVPLFFFSGMKRASRLGPEHTGQSEGVTACKGQ